MTGQELQILEAMLSRIEQCEKTNNMLLNANKELIRSNHVLEESLNTLRYEYECFENNCAHEVLDPRCLKGETYYPHVYSVNETIDALLGERKSLCRFGDGEFACISGHLRAGFTTKYYKKLAERLQEILLSDRDDVMIAIADNYGDLSCYMPQTRREIRSYMTAEIRREHAALLSEDRYYYNAYITRPFTFLYNDLDQMKLYIDRFKELWKGKKVVIIEGENTGFGAGNDLLDGCSEIKRIIAPAIDAYEKYDDILEAAASFDRDSLYLIALGPVATVLAYDLAKTGRHSVDIGHLDIEYEWMKMGKYRVPITNKYTNEVLGGNSPEPISDEKYIEQIIARFV